MQFRKDINGLRAVAVIAVVVFHFYASALPGGFAGVDVFFVISGFLMTGIIFKGIEQDKFSLARFRSEEHTSELQSRGLISYAVFCLKKKKKKKTPTRLIKIQL